MQSTKEVKSELIVIYNKAHVIDIVSVRASLLPDTIMSIQKYGAD